MSKMSHEEFMERFKNTNSWLYHNTTVISEYNGMDKPIYFMCKYGEIFINASYALEYSSDKITTRSAVNKTSFFINQLKEIYGEENLIYDNVVFLNHSTKVEIICKKHGKFHASPSTLLKGLGLGCPNCSRDYTNSKNRKDLNWFLEESKAIHNDKFEYPFLKNEFNGSYSRISIRCKKCGDVFKQNVFLHLRGCGCKKCAISNRRMKEHEFIKKAKETHGEKYGYDCLNYEIATKNVRIYCKECNDYFMQTPSKHIYGNGCPECARINGGYKKSDWVIGRKNSINFESYKLYILRCYDDKENFLKVGITYKDIKERFHANRDITSCFPYYYEILDIIESSDGSYIWDLEKRVHKKFKKYKYLPNKEFGGMYECFSLKFSKEISNFIEKIKEE
jgi:Zn finger protein HypA/HybF involved in hydrogenase expression